MTKYDDDDDDDAMLYQRALESWQLSQLSLPREVQISRPNDFVNAQDSIGRPTVDKWYNYYSKTWVGRSYWKKFN